ncbi:putative anaphase-promoting complex subunit 5 [Podospora australis]|uniref:Anaphase-promoting complex subunit 5 n=1 Tax=Podospora australis TaxID=1536484 RepID=A0AAN6WJS9_9PEZI|nr:putative anaphase-promoting complex subunit 5 [Podospora australis]
MSRYLTPAKIGLLALIELYVEGAVPTNGIIPVINFLTSHLLDCDLINGASTSQPNPADRWSKAEGTVQLITSHRDFEKLLSPLAAADKLPGRRLWDRFLEKLWQIESFDALHVFFRLRPNLLVKTRDDLRRMAERGEELPSEEELDGRKVLLSKNSPFGAFVRRCHLEFIRLRFNHTTDLWRMFVEYRQPTAPYWRQRHPQYGRLSFDSVLMTGQHEWGPRQTEELAVVAYGDMRLANDCRRAWPISTDDVEGLLEFQIEQIQKFGTRIPPELRDRFRRLMKDSLVVPSLSHYLNFSDAWRSGDFPSSFDYLHRYFDYTMQNRDRLFYQYALMNLAIVQSDFGCHKEAVATMLETVSTARENRDMTCLNFALNWFFHFGRAHPGLVRELENSSMLGGGKETLAYLRAKAKESGMWILWSSALLSEAKLGMAHGESVASALEHMVRSSQLIVERNMKTMMGAQLSMCVTIWDRLGLSPMSVVTCEVFLSCHARNSVFDDELRITCRLAGLLAGKGKYQDAFRRLEGMDSNSLRSAKPRQYWHLYRGLLKLRRDLHRNHLPAADALLSQLLQTGPEDLEPDMVFVIDTLHIEALIRGQDFEQAFIKVDRLLGELREDNRDIALRIRLLLTKAHLFDCVGRPEKGFTIAMRAASMSWGALIVPLLWQSMSAIANILNALGEFDAAAKLIISVLPRVLETDVSFTAGTLYSLLADARMGMAGEAAADAEAFSRRDAASGGPAGEDGNEYKPAKRQQRKYMLAAHAALGSAFDHFSAVEDVQKQCEMLAKQASLMRAFGDGELAKDYAAKYIALKREIGGW